MTRTRSPSLAIYFGAIRQHQLKWISNRSQNRSVDIEDEAQGRSGNCWRIERVGGNHAAINSLVVSCVASLPSRLTVARPKLLSAGHHMALTRDLSCGSRCCSPGVEYPANIGISRENWYLKRERETAHGRGMQSGSAGK